MSLVHADTNAIVSYEQVAELVGFISIWSCITSLALIIFQSLLLQVPRALGG